MKIGVTGANGFVGTHVMSALANAGHEPCALVRDATRMQSTATVEAREIGDLGQRRDRIKINTALQGLDAVIHLAAHVHVMSHVTDETPFFEVNVDGSRALFEAAADAGVKRVIFISSVKAVGERTTTTPMSAETQPQPEDAYGRSKLVAEKALRTLAHGSSVDLTILRAPFVYGWPASGNFATVVKAVQKGWPLPFLGIKNRRDVLYVGNLADAIVHAADALGLQPVAYYLSDGQPVSTPALFYAVAKAFRRPARLFYLPPQLLVFATKLLGKAAIAQRLTENLEVDDNAFRRDASWQPPYNMAEGLADVAQAATSSTKKETQRP